MKTKRQIRKLTLTRETLLHLEEDRLQAAQGAAFSYPQQCPISYPRTACLTNCGTGVEC